MNELRPVQLFSTSSSAFEFVFLSQILHCAVGEYPHLHHQLLLTWQTLNALHPHFVHDTAGGCVWRRTGLVWLQMSAVIAHSAARVSHLNVHAPKGFFEVLAKERAGKPLACEERVAGVWLPRFSPFASLSRINARLPSLPAAALCSGQTHTALIFSRELKSVHPV